MSDNFAPDALRATLRGLLPESGESEYPRELRFLRMCFRRLRARQNLVLRADDPQGLAVFVLRKDWTGNPDWQREVRMQRTQQAFAGRIWLTNEIGHSADSVEHDCDTETVFQRLADLEVGDCPTVIFDPSTEDGELMFYPQGSDNFMISEEHSLGEPERLSVHDACSVIEYVYDLSLKSPQHQIDKVSTWSSPPRWWVSQTAEAQIQSLVRIAFGARYLGLRVDSEQDVDSGRFDLRVGWVLDDARPRWDGVLELKVVKTYGERGNNYSAAMNLEALRKGLVQAHTYRVDSPADWSILCVFDHRRDEDDCFADIRDAAADRGVELRSWRMYNAVEAYRNAKDEAVVLARVQDN